MHKELLAELMKKLDAADLAYVDLWDTEVGVAMPQEQWEDISETRKRIRQYLNEHPEGKCNVI